MGQSPLAESQEDAGQLVRLSLSFTRVRAGRCPSHRDYKAEENQKQGSVHAGADSNNMAHERGPAAMTMTTAQARARATPGARRHRRLQTAQARPSSPSASRTQLYKTSCLRQQRRGHQPTPSSLRACCANAARGNDDENIIIPQGLLYKQLPEATTTRSSSSPRACSTRRKDDEWSRADDDDTEQEHVASPSSGGGGRPPLRRQPGPCLVLLDSSAHEHKNNLRRLWKPPVP